MWALLQLHAAPSGREVSGSEPLHLGSEPHAWVLGPGHCCPGLLDEILANGCKDGKALIRLCPSADPCSKRRVGVSRRLRKRLLVLAFRGLRETRLGPEGEVAKLCW